MTCIGVLALQGDFVEHIAVLQRLGVETHQVRKPSDLADLDGLIIPGGESTSFSRLMLDFQLHQPLQQLIAAGLPTWGTCAGLIVLAQRASHPPYPTLGALDISIRRNAYGRQVDSFEADVHVPALGATPFHAIFIRAPIVDDVGPNIDVLARLPSEQAGLPPTDSGSPQGSAIAVRQGNLLATTFHPELSHDARFHRYFLDIVRNHKERRSSPK